MTFEEILDQALAMLQRRGRVTYRLLKRQFQLDDDTLADLLAELRYAHREAISEDEQGMVWTGGAAVLPTLPSPALQPFQPSTSQEAPSPQADVTPTTPQSSDAERRQLTVLFCDLVDATVLSSQLDPEDLRAVVRAYQEVCAKVVARFEGHIAQYLGDGLLVYFGYPLAHEDDAQRAVRAGLGIVEAMEQLNTRLTQERGVQLAVRLAIHTGLVVVGEVGGGTRQEQLALGETPNVAARLQGIAAPNTLVISATTFQLLGGFFACQPLGTPLLKGLVQPLVVYRVLYESMARSRLEATSSTGWTPLVGREQESGLLRERWAQIKEGIGQVVLLSGEAGIGKSRLVQVLREQVASEPQAWLTPCQCSPYHRHSALYPLIELLERVALRFEREETAPQKLYKLEGFLVQYGLPLAEVILGREFSYALLQAVSPWDETTLHRGVQQLVEAEFVYQQGLPPQATYLFKHALIQDTAYQSLLRSTRQQYHQRIAQALEAQCPETAETQPELLAYHYTAAGCWEQAVDYWQRAGTRAVQHSANADAVQHLTQGLHLIARLPETPRRAHQELDLHLTLGIALVATKGQAAPEVEQTYIRARALCAQVGDTPQRFLTLWGLQRFYRNRGALSMARELGEQLVWLAQRAGDPMQSLEAHDALGATLFALGEYAAARPHLEQAIAFTDPTTQRALALRHGIASGVRCLAVAANALWRLGFPDQAVQRSREALALAQELTHPLSLMSAQYWAAWLHYVRREVSVVQALTDALLTLATTQGFPLYVGYGTCWRGWVLVMQGEGAAGLAQLRQGMAAILAAGHESAHSLCLLLLAEAIGHAGQVEDGLDLLTEALTAFETSQRGDMLTGSVSIPGRVDATPGPPGCGPSGSFLPVRRRRGPPSAGQILGAAGGDEPELPVAAAGQTCRGLRAVGTGLRLVHRGL